MGDILDGNADYDAVRNLIGIDETVMADSVLETFPFLGVVEALVEDAFSDWATILAGDDVDTTFLKTGTACLTAIRLRLRLALSGYGGGFSVRGYSQAGSSIEWDDVYGQLAEWASEAFGSMSTHQDDLDSRFTIIVRDGPTRSKSNVPTTAEQWYERVFPRVLDWFEEAGTEDDTLV